MPFSVGPIELIIVLVLALLVIGPGKLPEVGNALGRTIREFRKASTEVEDTTRLEPAPSPAAAAKPVSTAAAPSEAEAAGEDRTAS